MIRLTEKAEATDDRLCALLRQIGCEEVVGIMDGAEESSRNFLDDESQESSGIEVPVVQDDRGDYPWDAAPVAELVAQYARNGLRLGVLEDSPPLDLARMGRAGRDGQIEWFSTMLRSLAKAGVPVVCYTWMAGFDWMRTSVDTPARGGALVTSYDHQTMEAAGPTRLGLVSEAEAWNALEYFLHRVLPVAEEVGIKLALHPDDPPVSPVRGLGRVVTSLDALQRVLDLADSPSNGLTFCQGNVALMTDDVPAAIEHFGRQEKIFFVHFRDVEGTAEHFTETFHDNGPTDMWRCMQAYQAVGYDGLMRSDHVPTLAGEQNLRPGYEVLGKLHATGYMAGLAEAARATIG
jgi:mannonate dehydratase